MLKVKNFTNNSGIGHLLALIVIVLAVVSVIYLGWKSRGINSQSNKIGEAILVDNPDDAYLKWEIYNPSYSGDPTQIKASVIFTQLEMVESETIEMEYIGEDTWAFEFYTTIDGDWHFRTVSSDDPELDDIRGIANMALKQ